MPKFSARWKQNPRQVPVPGATLVTFKIKNCSHKNINRAPLLHLSLWSCFEFLVYWILIAYENNNWAKIIIYVRLLLLRHISLNRYCTLYETPVKVFLSCWFSSTKVLIEHTLCWKKCAKLMKIKYRLFGQYLVNYNILTIGIIHTHTTPSVKTSRAIITSHTIDHCD